MTAFWIIAIALNTGCQSPNPPSEYVAQVPQVVRGNHATAPAAPPPPILKVGGVGYIRVKTYTLMSGPAAETDSGGGCGYNVKNLGSPDGTMLAMSSVSSNTPKFSFGESLKLIKRGTAVPPTWVVMKGNRKIELPTYLLTASKPEIDYLKSYDRVPESMAFVYKDKTGDVRVWDTSMG